MTTITMRTLRGRNKCVNFVFLLFTKFQALQPFPTLNTNSVVFLTPKCITQVFFPNGHICSLHRSTFLLALMHQLRSHDLVAQFNGADPKRKIHNFIDQIPTSYQAAGFKTLQNTMQPGNPTFTQSHAGMD